MSNFIILLAELFAVTFVLTLHEYAHARVAYWCGDPTAKFSGRMTLNPVKHFDPIGIVAYVLAGFGWAKPVPVNPNNFRSYKSGTFWTSAAGVIVNYLTAFLFFGLYIVVDLYVLPNFYGTYMAIFLFKLISCIYLYSLSFCIFNLLPVYPLDGFRIVDAFTKRRGKVYWAFRTYGQYVLLGLIGLHYLATYVPYLAYIDLLGYVLRFAQEIFSYPIVKFWGLIFN